MLEDNAERIQRFTATLRQPRPALRLFWPGLIPRNLFFLAIVFLHGFRRLLPPY
jgi:hypothetical protein